MLGIGGPLRDEDPPHEALHPHSSTSSGPRSRAAAMNCRAEVLEVSVEGRQVEEAMLAVLHTVLLHRSTGKFHYKKEGTYSIGTVGTQDVDCDFIDFAYVRVSSEELDRALRKAVGEFKVGSTGGAGGGWALLLNVGLYLWVICVRGLRAPSGSLQMATRGEEGSA